ncbi:hypothetical protein, partial [Mobiluncus mulieris]|uniref:hypothetical protein n=1 Tax=Mobiluncus mulieris TaxID=2052 RepID=UPI001B8C0A4D
TLTVQPKSQVQTTFIPSSLETPTKNQEKINTFCPLSLKSREISGNMLVEEFLGNHNLSIPLSFAGFDGDPTYPVDAP